MRTLEHENVNSKSAVAALLVVIIVSAVALLMAYSASILGIGELDLGYTAQQGAESFSIADGCIEETLRRIRLNPNYGIGAGQIGLTVSNGTCIIQVTDLGSNQRRITVAATMGEYHKEIEATLTLTGNIISIGSWREVEN
ncbi:hypothetical protein MYX07_03620 [Patescibacteria group bacterium AH-259-L07]|nr:hypothetical protein [Patescibacteria group bacterium AH-259-L07]